MNAEIMRKSLIAIGVVLLIASGLCPAAVPADFLYRNTSADNTGMPYRIFVPPGYDAANAYPLIVFLHGAGEAGTNNTAQISGNANGAMKLISDANLAIQPTLIAAPQCPTNSSCRACRNSILPPRRESTPP